MSLRPSIFCLGIVLPLALATGTAWGQTTPGGSVSIQGLRTITDPEARALIESQLEYIDENGTSTARADDAAFFLESALRDRGYEDARVNWKLPSPGRIVLDVNEGARLILVGVKSVGNTALSDEALLELMTSDTRERLDLKLDDEIPYVVDDVEAGRNHVKEYYELLGYIGAEVTLFEPDVDPNPPRNRASVKLEIAEGMIHKVGEIKLGDPPEPALATKFAEVQNDYADENFSPSFAAQLKARLRDIATDAGYFEAEVEVTALDPVDAGEFKRVNLTATANYGRKYHVDQIQLSGNEKVKPRYFERRFQDVTGQPYNPDATSEIVADMLATGAFRRVTAAPDVADELEGTLHLVVEVEEAKRQELGLAIGAGTYEGAIVGIDYRHLNLFGLVRRLDAKLEASSRGISGNIDYIDPWFFWTDWEAKASIFSRSRINEGYSKAETGLRAEFRREFAEIHAVTLFAQTSYTDLYEFEIDPQFLGDRTYLDSFIGLSYELDQLDDKAAPRSGYFFQSSLTYSSTAFAGDFDYLRSTVRLNYHLPIGSTTLHLGARSGLLYGTGGGESDVLPIDLRYFSGGGRSVRSFRERDLGPRDGGYPIGGEFFTTFNAEYEIPVAGPVSLALFADAGNLIYDFENVGLDEMHYAAGLGIRINSPLGPLRIDYGHNLNRGDNEPSGSFHIGFGIAY